MSANGSEDVAGSSIDVADTETLRGTKRLLADSPPSGSDRGTSHQLQDIRLLFVSLLQPVKGLFVVAKTQASVHKRIGRHIACFLASVKFRKQPGRIAGPPRVTGARRHRDVLLGAMLLENRRVYWGSMNPRTHIPGNVNNFCALSWTLKLPAEICFSGLPRF
jgi:hypothetical protein